MIGRAQRGEFPMQAVTKRSGFVTSLCVYPDRRPMALYRTGIELKAIPRSPINPGKSTSRESAKQWS
jgi:hypothetical protein